MPPYRRRATGNDMDEPRSTARHSKKVRPQAGFEPTTSCSFLFEPSPRARPKTAQSRHNNLYTTAAN